MRPQNLLSRHIIDIFISMEIINPAPYFYSGFFTPERAEICLNCGYWPFSQKKFLPCDHESLQAYRTYFQAYLNPDPQARLLIFGAFYTRKMVRIGKTSDFYHSLKTCLTICDHQKVGIPEVLSGVCKSRPRDLYFLTFLWAQQEPK